MGVIPALFTSVAIGCVCLQASQEAHQVTDVGPSKSASLTRERLILGTRLKAQRPLRPEERDTVTHLMLLPDRHEVVAVYERSRRQDRDPPPIPLEARPEVAKLPEIDTDFLEEYSPVENRFEFWSGPGGTPSGVCIMQGSGTPLVSRVALNRIVAVNNQGEAAVSLWDLVERQRQKIFKIPRPRNRRSDYTMPPSVDGIRAIALSENGRWIAVGGYGIYDVTVVMGVESGQIEHRFRTASRARCLTSLMFDPAGSLLASGNCDGFVELRKRESGLVMHSLTRDDREVISIAFSRDGEKLAHASMDEVVQIWDVRSGRSLRKLNLGAGIWVNSLEFSPDGDTLVTGGSDDTVRVWDVKTGSELAHARCRESKINGVRAVLFSADGRSIYASDGDEVIRFDRFDR